jgi:SAM-dependent methyltransferase
VPNFPPLRRYVFSVVDRWIARYGLSDPFLEVGCGTGELAAHLAARGWRGTALDTSPAAVARARARLAASPAAIVTDAPLASLPREAFRTAFCMDVIEHVRDDGGLLAAIAERLAPGGALILLTPVNPAEWRHDDVLYGHVRRYAWEELEDRLRGAGLKSLETWNVTVPFVWALRRIYLALLPARGPGRPPDELTAASSIFNPWDDSRWLSRLGRLAGHPALWAPLFRIQDRFARSRAGHAAMVLARKP